MHVHVISHMHTQKLYNRFYLHLMVIVYCFKKNQSYQLNQSHQSYHGILSFYFGKDGKIYI